MIYRQVENIQRKLSEAQKLERFDSWIKREWKWVVMVASVLTLLGLVWFFILPLGRIYELVYTKTTGEQYTQIMRKHIEWLLIPVGAVLSFLVLWARVTSDDTPGLPEKIKPTIKAAVTLRVIATLFAATGLGVLIGHVIW